MNTNQIIKQAQKDFFEKHVRKVSQGAVSVGELYGVQFKQQIIKDIVWTDPKDVWKFIDQAVTQAVEEERERIVNAFAIEFGEYGEEVIDKILDKLTK